ncbi:EexN family lipoprotein [Phaeobacter inhibens]|uniref:EexN family lipoprotein n=1 Tax=Phaeobacter inhibens TaxID=221822 RepID=UPI0021A5DCA5|nr:EexN family lipoprotein [Phaeobacter inhibens]UWR88045.1 EexN family lipoprotein [Phaeobacter inhibens]
MNRLITAVCLVVLTGCNEEESKTVEHFIGAPAERAETLAKCETLDAADADCANAQTAENLTESNANLNAAQKYFGD